MDNLEPAEQIEEGGRVAHPRGVIASCMLWFVALQLVALVVIGGLASTGRLGRRPQRFDLPSGGTVEFTEIITGTTLQYTSGNRFQKLARHLPPIITQLLPASWQRGSTIIFGNRGSGIAVGLVLTFRGTTSTSYNPSIQIADGKGWCSTSSVTGQLGSTADEFVNIFQLGILPHDAPDLHLRLYTGNLKPSKPVAEFIVPNPMFNNPPVSAAAKMSPKLQAADGDLTVRMFGATTNVSTEAWDSLAKKPTDLRRAQSAEPGCTIVEWEALVNGQPSADYRPNNGTVADAFGNEDWMWSDTQVLPKANHFHSKLSCSLPGSGPWYRLGLNFYHHKNFYPDELWTLQQEVPTTATTSASVTSNTVKGPLEFYIGGPGFKELNVSPYTIGKDEFGVYVRSDASWSASDARLELFKAEGPGKTKYNWNSNGSTYVSRSGSGKPFMLYYWYLRPKKGSSAPAEPATSVTLTFSVVKPRHMEFVVKPEQAK